MTETLDFDVEFLDPEEDEQEQAGQEDMLGSPPDPNDEFIEQKVESAKAKRYRIKTKRGLNFLLKGFAANPNTVADAAAIIQHGPGIASAVGQLADKDPRVAKAIDFITEDGIDNPYLLTGLAIMPFAFQVLRNHEPPADKLFRPSVKIPFTKRRLSLPFSFKIKLNFVRNNTYAPDFLTTHVFGNPAIREALRKNDIHVAWPNNMNGRS